MARLHIPLQLLAGEDRTDCVVPGHRLREAAENHPVGHRDSRGGDHHVLDESLPAQTFLDGVVGLGYKSLTGSESLRYLQISTAHLLNLPKSLMAKTKRGFE